MGLRAGGQEPPGTLPLSAPAGKITKDRDEGPSYSPGRPTMTPNKRSTPAEYLIQTKLTLFDELLRGYDDFFSQQPDQILRIGEAHRLENSFLDQEVFEHRPILALPLKDRNERNLM